MQKVGLARLPAAHPAAACPKNRFGLTIVARLTAAAQAGNRASPTTAAWESLRDGAFDGSAALVGGCPRQEGHR